MGTTTSTSQLILILVTAHLLLFSVGRPQASPVVYTQPPVFPASFNGWTSDKTPDNVPKGNEEYQTWDHFTVPQSALIDSVSWQGFYWDLETPGNNPVEPETVSWEVSFWSDNNGEPLAPLQMQLLPAASVQRTSAGFTLFEGGTVPVFNFHVALNPFLALSSTTYWLSILSISPTFNPLWSWMEGTGGNDSTFQVNLINGDRFVRPGDRTFSLEGQSVPEPNTLSLLLVGAGSFWGYRRLCETARKVLPTLAKKRKMFFSW